MARFNYVTDDENIENIKMYALKNKVDAKDILDCSVRLFEIIVSLKSKGEDTSSDDLYSFINSMIGRRSGGSCKEVKL